MSSWLSFFPSPLLCQSIMHMSLCLVVLLLIRQDVQAATYKRQRGYSTENFKDDMAALSSKLLDTARQKQRAVKLVSDLKDAARGAYITIIGPYHRALHRSWSSFTGRSTRLLHETKLACSSATIQLHQLHETALLHTEKAVKSTPFLRALFPPDANCELLLVYGYLLLGVVAFRLGVAFVRNVMYA